MHDHIPADLENVKAALAALQVEFHRIRDRVRRSESLRAEHAARLGEDLRDLFSALVADRSGNDSRDLLDAGNRLLELARELAQPDPHDQAPLSPPQEPAAEPQSRTVLYIEDFAPVAQVLQIILEQRPHVRLVHAEDGCTGLRLARELHPALILLDLHLPDMSGAELLEILKQDSALASTPVIVISGDGMPAQVERMLQAGARNYLTKPLEARRFLCTIDDILPA